MLFLCASHLSLAETRLSARDYSVGAQYDTTHVYLQSVDFDAFVNSFTATFGGHLSPRITANIAPVPSSTQLQYVWTPVGTLSTFAFETPIPYPFGQERTGWLVTDIDQALAAARAAGAEVIVAKFKDPIGYDAIIQWTGGVKMQLYWHFTAPSYAPLELTPETRVYVSRDAAGKFLHDFLKFSHGTVLSDDRNSSGSEIGEVGEHYRRVRISSGFGRMQVMVTDGHLPYPFGREITGYEVRNLDSTLEKAKASGATLLTGPMDAGDRRSAMVQFPGGYIAELHSQTPAR
jgi:predicted enzyme related to lactoylglutathione lyase